MAVSLTPTNTFERGHEEVSLVAPVRIFAVARGVPAVTLVGDFVHD